MSTGSAGRQGRGLASLMGNLVVGLVPHPTKSVRDSVDILAGGSAWRRRWRHVRLVARGRRRDAHAGRSRADRRAGSATRSTRGRPRRRRHHARARCGSSSTVRCRCSGSTTATWASWSRSRRPSSPPRWTGSRRAFTLEPHSASRSCTAPGTRRGPRVQRRRRGPRPGEGVGHGRPRRGRRRTATTAAPSSSRRRPGRPPTTTPPVGRSCRRGRRDLDHPGGADVGHRPVGRARPARAAALPDRRGTHRRRSRSTAASSPTSSDGCVVSMSAAPGGREVIRLDADLHAAARAGSSSACSTCRCARPVARARPDRRPRQVQGAHGAPPRAAGAEATEVLLPPRRPDPHLLAAPRLLGSAR